MLVALVTAYRPQGLKAKSQLKHAAGAVVSQVQPKLL